MNRKNSYICVIGGANIDIQGFPDNKLVMKDSNPGVLKTSLGGVGRNIAEILARLGMPVKLITAIGNDTYGRKILEDAVTVNLDISNVLISEKFETSKYLSILDKDGDMTIALADMKVMNCIDKNFIDSKSGIIENAKICIIDANLDKNIIKYITEKFREGVFFLDTVSTAKTKKVKDIIGNFHTIKPNKIEAEILAGCKIDNYDDFLSAANYFHSKNVKRIFVTCADKGIFYSDSKEQGFIKAPELQVVNATGAGDAFIAGLAYSYYKDLNIKESILNAIAASVLALISEKTINPLISENELKKIKKEYELC